MKVVIMATDGGPHSAEYWAVTTASQIIDIADDAKGEQVAAGRRLESKIIDILEGHHGAIQSAERAKIAESHDRILVDHTQVEHDVAGMVADIVAAAKGTVFEAHFAKDDVQKHVFDTLASHFATSQHIERSWHADRNPALPQAKAFRARWQNA